MSPFCSLRRLPRAGLDPIDSPEIALATLHAMIDPWRHETIVLFLDHRLCGISVLAVNGTVPFDALFDVLERVVTMCGDSDRTADVEAVVVATVRPPIDGVPDLDAGDADRWLEASAMLDDAGIDLLEWFVVGHRTSCPRDELGEPPRWRRSAA